MILYPFLHTRPVAASCVFGSTIGFDRVFRIEDEPEFVAAMLADMAPPPSEAARIRAINAGREPLAA